MKKKKVYREGEGFFARCKRKISDFFYNLFQPVGAKIQKMRNKKSLGKIKTKKLIFCIAVLALPLLQVAIMYFGVNFNSFFLAFKEYKIDGAGNMAVSWVGFDNIVKFASNVFSSGGALFHAFLNSLIVFGSCILVGIPLALIFSYYIYKKKFAYKFFHVVLFLPGIISSIAMVMLFTYFADRAIPAIAKAIGINMIGLLSGSNTAKIFAVIIFYNIFIGFGASVLMYSNAMSTIPPELSEAAQLDGCGPMQEFIRIVLPLIYPTIATFLVVNVAGMFTAQANLYSFYAENAEPELQTIGYWFFMQTMVGRDSQTSYPYVAAGGLFFTVITVPITLIVRRILDKFDPQVEV